MTKLAGEYVYSHYVDNKDKHLYAAPDRIVDILGVPMSGFDE